MMIGEIEVTTKFAALRAQNLAEEIVVGWDNQTNLSGFDHALTAHALDHFSDALQWGTAEAHSDEFARETIALCSRLMAREMEESDSSELFYEQTMLASKALAVLSRYLQAECDELKAQPAKAA